MRVMNTTHSSRRRLAIAATAMALAILAAAWFTSAPTVNPIDRIYDAADAMKGGEHSSPRGRIDFARARELANAPDAPPSNPDAVVHTHTPGWNDAMQFGIWDDWEPAVAADPNDPYVYVMATRYTGPDGCVGCPHVKNVLRVSSDGGMTFGPDTFPVAIPDAKNQYDSILEVSEDGVVHAAMLQGYVPGVTYTKSEDHGETWSTPINFPPNWSDKEVLAVSPDGVHVYIAFNGPSAGDAYVAQSHDGGDTWTTAKEWNTKRYSFAGDAYANDSGLVIFAQNDFDQFYTGKINTFVLVSTDYGENFERVVVDTGERQPDCTSQWCYDGFYGSVPAIAGTEDGTLVVVYARANRPARNQRVYVSRSTDDGQTWSRGKRVSDGTSLGVEPFAKGEGTSTFHIGFADKRTGRFKTWYRTSSDGGLTWSAAADLTTPSGGDTYFNNKGYPEIYGDYAEMAVNSAGKAIAVWGAGPSYKGPGGIWISVEA